MKAARHVIPSENTEDTLTAIDILITRIDKRFLENEQRIIKLQKDVTFLSCQIDGIRKSIEISEDERLVMAYQLGKIYAWAEQAGKRIGTRFDT